MTLSRLRLMQDTITILEAAERNLRKLELNDAPLGPVILDLEERRRRVLQHDLRYPPSSISDNADDAERDGGLGSGKWLGAEA